MTEEHDHLSIYPQAIITLAENPPYFSRMTECTSSACLKGPCGDTMEVYLCIKDGIIEEVSFFTEGCISTRACGSVAAQFVDGKSIDEALKLSPKIILDTLNDLPGHFHHCAILAATTFYRAVADYLLSR